MKIARIETMLLQAPLGDDRFWSSQRSFAHRKCLLVRIETDDGIVGWGEAGNHGPAEPVASMIHDVFAGVLRGRSPEAVEVLWDEMYAATRDFGRKGTVVEAISGLDIALWDIVGKLRGVPLYDLFGGAFRREVPTYATGLYYRGSPPLSLAGDLPRLRQEAAGYAAAGFPAVKMKVGLFSPADDLARVAAVRETIGEAMLLAVDANHAYQPHVACQFARGMEPHNVYWFEEPVVPEDIDGYRRVKSSTSIAIAGGECEFTRWGFAKWLCGRVLDIAQPDVCCAGGLSETRRIANLASSCHVQCLPHVWGSAIAVAAGLQILATLPPAPQTGEPLAPFNAPMLEWDANPNPLRTDLAVEPLRPKDGKMSVPTAPGLGIQINDEVLKRYLVTKR